MSFSVHIRNNSAGTIYVTLEDVGDTIVPAFLSRSPLASGDATKDYDVQKNKATNEGLVRFVVRLDPDQEPPESDILEPVRGIRQELVWPRP
jgi:hypothetical protein